MAKKSEVSNATKSSTTRKLRVKDGASGTSNDQSFPITIEPEKHNKQFFIILIIATALISSLFTFGLATNYHRGWLSEQLSRLKHQVEFALARKNFGLLLQRIKSLPIGLAL